MSSDELKENKFLKQKIIDYIYDKVMVYTQKYNIVKNVVDIQNIKNKKYYISANSCGINSFIIFKEFDNNFASFLIDRRSLSHTKNKVNLDDIRLTPVTYGFDEMHKKHIYNGTILDGILIDNGNIQSNAKQTFLLTDIFVIFNGIVTKIDYKKKIFMFKHLFNNDFSNCDNSIDIIISKPFEMNQIKELFNDYILNNQRKLHIKGLVLYPEFSETKLIYIFDKEDERTKLEIMNIQKNSDDNYNAKQLLNNASDNFNLDNYKQNENPKFLSNNNNFNNNTHRNNYSNDNTFNNISRNNNFKNNTYNNTNNTNNNNNTNKNNTYNNTNNNNNSGNNFNNNNSGNNFNNNNNNSGNNFNNNNNNNGNNFKNNNIFNDDNFSNSNYKNNDIASNNANKITLTGNISPEIEDTNNKLEIFDSEYATKIIYDLVDSEIMDDIILVFEMHKTAKPDVYNLFSNFNEKNEIVKKFIDISYINTYNLSLICKMLFATTDVINMSCIYNSHKRKWIPIAPSNESIGFVNENKNLKLVVNQKNSDGYN